MAETPDVVTHNRKLQESKRMNSKQSVRYSRPTYREVALRIEFSFRLNFWDAP